jgi:hypothetical protein
MAKELQGELNRLAGTVGKAEQGAANAWAGTSGLATPAALRVKALALGKTVPHKADTAAILNIIAGTTGLDAPGAASKI